METAPLVLAHTHARNAAQETKRANPVAASEEHDLAAAEFAVAAQSTNDQEALRILNLLEQHHKRLGQILKSTHSKSSHNEVSTDSATTEPPSIKQTTNSNRSRSPETTIHPPRLTNTTRSTARDLSSSIANNLASARGIPNNRPKRTAPVSPLVSNQHADGTITQDQTYSKLTKRGSSSEQETRPSWAPPLDVGTKSGPNRSSSQDTTTSDAPFQQFYSTFESLLSKIPATLAFAGLPLTSTTQQSEPPAGPVSPAKSSKKSQLKSRPLEASVDYSQIISRAALRAVRNETSNPSESFMIVPPSGHTASYAEIMNRVDYHGHHHHRDTSHGSNDDFVDAASQFLPEFEHQQISTNTNRGKNNNEPKYQGKTMEELALENQTLKHMSDIISKRLHAFEMSAQTSSAALAQSIRTLQISSPITTPENSRGKPGGTTTAAAADENDSTALRTQRRIEELEEVLKKYDRKLQRREDENAKLKDTLGKYKEKWDSLKAGAKARREANSNTTTAGGGGRVNVTDVSSRRSDKAKERSDSAGEG